MVSESTRLKVIIVGAGIAGLAVARALRENHEVIILEQSHMKNEVGAAILMGPNASRVLLQFGLSPKRVGSVYCTRVIERTYQNVTQMEFHVDTEKEWGSPWLLNHRADLHEELRRLATSPDFPGEPPELRLGCTVVSCDPESGNVTLSDGSFLQGDVIIGMHYVFCLIFRC
jgi:salicylate hydroxylase